MTATRLLIATTVLLAACEPIATGPATLSPSISSSPSAQPSVSPSTPAPTPTADPSFTYIFDTRTTGWRPTTATLMVFELNPSMHTSAGGTLIAVPLDGSSPTPLVWMQEMAVAVRPDGGAVATGADGGVAIWEPSGAARWLVPPDPTTVTQGALWAPDGAYLYFGRVKPVVGGSAEDLGIFRVRADGSGLQKIVDGQSPRQSPPFFSVPRRVTPENVLIWGRAYEGASIEVLDLASGRRRTYESGFGGVGDLLAWRSTQPRALIQHCLIGGCRGLVEWNDETGATRRVFSDDVEVRGADRDPSGARIVVARRSADWGLDLVDGASVARIPGTGNAQWPRWLDTGIAYLWGAQDQGMGVTPLTELRIIAPTGGTPRVLYRASSPEHNLFIVDVVKR
jgi:hypothetical protein